MIAGNSNGIAVIGMMAEAGPRRIRLTRARWLLAGFVLFLLIAGTQCFVSAQQPARDMAEDPHYRLLLENAAVRVFAVTIPPRQEAFVAHPRSFLTVTLQDSDVIIWRTGESPLRHFLVPPGETHFFSDGPARGIRNESNAEYRNITVEFKDPRVTNYGYRPETGKRGYGPVVIGPPVDPHGHFVNSLDLEDAVVNDVQLLPKEKLEAHQPSRAELLIALSTLDLSSDAGELQLDSGGIDWFESGRSGVVNRGTAPARFVMVGIRSQVSGQHAGEHVMQAFAFFGPGREGSLVEELAVLGEEVNH